MAESGARVIATARSPQKAPGLQALAQQHGAERLQVVAADVTDAASLQARVFGPVIRPCRLVTN